MGNNVEFPVTNKETRWETTRKMSGVKDEKFVDAKIFGQNVEKGGAL